MSDTEARYIETAAAALGNPCQPANHNLPPKEQLRQSVVLTSLENLMKLDDDPEFRKHVCRRFLTLTDAKPEQDIDL